MLIPSIDLYDGQAVQWKQGKEPVIARDDVFELFDEFSLYGEVAIIDLNAATGKGNNRELITKLLARGKARVGGGIRDLETAQFYLKAGASKLILGTACQESFVEKLPKEALIFSIDAKGDNWTTHGWQEESAHKVTELIQPLAERCSEFLYTQVEKEGMMAGLDRERIEQVIKLSPVPVTIAGGITDLDDIEYLSRLGANMQIGMAIYTGAINLEDCFIRCLDFNKSTLIPTIVQDYYSGDVLMLAYSNEDSLRYAFKNRSGTYFSRSRQALWEKGKTSGNTQELISVDFDCDGDSLLFRVIQKNEKACHLNRWSCFPRSDSGFTLADLDRTLAQRQSCSDANSYSKKLFDSEALQIEKLREECEELIEAKALADVRWEAADLLFFTLVNARAKGVSLQAIVNELRSRHK